MITIVDNQMGNIGSIANMIAKVGGQARITSDPAEIRTAEKLVLPGVGHFDRGMANLRELGLATALEDAIMSGETPILGVCLGMQLMCFGSEEGIEPGLGWINARVRRFAPRDVTLRIPHMGWNTVRPVRESPLFSMDPEEPDRFYFVHNYFVQCDDPEDVLAWTDYGNEFCSAFSKGNLWGVQFHPEKSHAFGMNLFRGFLDL